MGVVLLKGSGVVAKQDPLLHRCIGMTAALRYDTRIGDATQKDTCLTVLLCYRLPMGSTRWLQWYTFARRARHHSLPDWELAQEGTTLCST
jgi:hypothetical protein